MTRGCSFSVSAESAKCRKDAEAGKLGTNFDLASSCGLPVIGTARRLPKSVVMPSQEAARLCGFEAGALILRSGDSED